MKQLFTLVTLFCAMFVSQNAMAGGGTPNTFYAKCKVQVAAESVGRGTVYLVDDSDNEVEETNSLQTGLSGDGAYVSFRYKDYPAEGYVLENFTDADGKVYEVGNNMFSVYATSKDEADPTVFNLFANFKEATADDLYEHYEGTVYSSIKFGTAVFPAELTLPEGVNAYTVDAIEDNVLVFSKLADKVPADTPVLLENTTVADVVYGVDIPKDLIVSGVHTKGILHGVYVDNYMAPAGSYVFMVLPKVCFQKTEDTVPVTAFNCYIYSEDATAETLDINTGILTGINKVLSGEEKVQIFDAAGRSLNSLQKGINIVNGVKVMVK